VYLSVNFQAEFINKILLIINKIKKIRIMTIFDQIGKLSPVYDEKSTTVESKTTTTVKIKTKARELFLVSLGVA
jgi:hypothetical protein